MLSTLSWFQSRLRTWKTNMDALAEEEYLKYRLGMCFKIIKEYSWLLDSYVLDFFTENHMMKLPGRWREQMERISLKDLYYLLNLSVKPQNIWPLAILSLRVLVRLLTLSREFSNAKDVNLIQSNKVDISQIPELYKIKSPCFKHPKLRNLFLKHVKPKKRYEIFKMARTTAEIADKLKVDYVIDVGSGLGHLSRMMAYGFQLNVCSIETEAQLTTQAAVMDSEFEKTASKYLSELDVKYLRHKRPICLNQTIRFDLSASDFVKNVKEAFLLPEGDIKFGIVGLHPCGDLASVLLRLYTNCPEARFINLVGCCYHKLCTSSGTEHGFRGFPLTDFCTEADVDISYEARALACHAIESYRERLLSRNCDHLKVHCYRAALERLIDKNCSQYRKHPLGNVKSVPKLTFGEYCRLALKKLDVSIPEEDLTSEDTLRMLLSWEDVVKYYSLRLMLAPLIETAILLDRKLYLLQKGAQCKIQTAFDPEISPRNQLLISEKIE